CSPSVTTSRPAASCRATDSSTARSSMRLNSAGLRSPRSSRWPASFKYCGRSRLPTPSLRIVSIISAPPTCGPRRGGLCHSLGAAGRLPSKPPGCVSASLKGHMISAYDVARETSGIMTPETPAQETIEVSARAWKVLEGAYDLQVHVGPDVIARRIDDIDCAREFLARGMKGFVLKSHYIQTGERAQVVTKAVPGSRVFGALTLNHSVGGLNPVAVELAGRTGCKIVWMPTVDAENETAGRLDGGTQKLPFWAKIQRELAAEGISPPPLSVVDLAGHLVEPARRCLERIAKHNMIL